MQGLWSQYYASLFKSSIYCMKQESMLQCAHLEKNLTVKLSVTSTVSYIKQPVSLYTIVCDKKPRFTLLWLGVKCLMACKSLLAVIYGWCCLYPSEPPVSLITRCSAPAVCHCKFCPHTNCTSLHVLCCTHKQCCVTLQYFWMMIWAVEVLHH